VCGHLQSANADEIQEVAMRQRITVLVVFSAAMVIGILSYSAHVSATPQSGFSSNSMLPFPKSTLAPFEVFNHAIVPNPKGDGDNDRDDKMLWLSIQETKGPSDFYIVNNTWLPVDPTGQRPVATTGWHSHPGHSLIIVTAGTLTDYESDDPECKPHVYTTGMSFVDSGGNHTHVIRNEGTILASDIAVQLVPAGAARKIDSPTVPPNCPNIQ
jgi:hypothetical protein